MVIRLQYCYFGFIARVCNVGTIPSAIGSCTNLGVLMLTLNNLVGTQSVYVIVIWSTFIASNKGTIPSTFGSLTNLEFVYLNGNSLVGINLWLLNYYTFRDYSF